MKPASGADGLVYLKLVVMAVCWGGQWVAGRHIAPLLPHYTAGAARFLIASVILVALLLHRERGWPSLSWRDWFAVSALGATGVFLFNAWFFAGLQTVPASRGALITGAAGVLSALGAWLFYAERMTAVRWAGAVLALCGVALVVSRGEPLTLFTGAVGAGELMLLGAVISWSAYTLIGRSAMRRMSPLAATTLSAVLGTLMLGIAAVFEDRPTEFAALPASAWWALGYLGVFGTVLAFFWYLEGVERLGPARAAAFINLVPVFGVLAGWLVLDEPLLPSLILGGLLVIVGVALVNRTAPRVQQADVSSARRNSRR